MSVRQYIGARYIPLFYGAWNDRVQYEPLTVVQYNGASYISKQYVPPNTQITNTNYWFLWSNFDAQIEGYRQEVRAVQDDVDTANTNAQNALNKANEIESDFNNLGTAATKNYTSTVAAGNNDLITSAGVKSALDAFTPTNIEKPFMVVFGDSWVDYSSSSRANFMPLVIDAMGIADNDWATFGIGGASFAYEPSNPEHTIGTQVNTALTQLTNDQIARTKYVLIVGGVNDFHIDVGTNYYNAIDEMINNCLTNFPNATILLAPNNCAPSYAGGVGGNITKSYRVFRASQTLYKKYSYGNTRVRVCPMSSIFWIFSDKVASECMTSDLLHLNATNGISLFANQILNGFGMKEIDDCYNYTIATGESLNVNSKIIFKYGQSPILEGRIRSNSAPIDADHPNDYVYYLNTKASELLYYLLYYADATGALPTSQRILYRMIWTPSGVIKYALLRMPANATGTNVMGELVAVTANATTTYYYG